MEVIRIYPGDDGESRIERVEIPLESSGVGLVSRLERATGVLFRDTRADLRLGYHNAPRRQFVINMGGETEIEAADGSSVRVPDGGIIFAEDVTGRGHITRSLGAACRTVCIEMPDSFDITKWRTSLLGAGSA